MNALKIMKPADIFSLGNALLGFCALFFIYWDRLSWAVTAIVLAAIFDLIDGTFARRTGTANDFGRELDSLADIVSFGVAPAFLGFALLQPRLLLVASPVIFLLCGIIRVGKFNVTSGENFYEGMPITLNALIFPVLYFLNCPDICMSLAFLISAVLMVSSLKFRKPRILR